MRLAATSWWGWGGLIHPPLYSRRRFWTVATWLKEGTLALPPLRFTLREAEPDCPDRGIWNFEIEAQWEDQSAVFAVAYKSLFTPKAFQQTLNQCRVARLPANRYPLVMLPYLRPEQLEELERNEISGVDWCGNGVVIVPDKMRVFRTQLLQLVTTKLASSTDPLVATGLSSVTRYATMQREERLSLYCPEAKRVQAAIGGRETDRFPNIELIETLEQPLYFDARHESGFYWASPVQT